MISEARQLRLLREFRATLAAGAMPDDAARALMRGTIADVENEVELRLRGATRARRLVFGEKSSSRRVRRVLDCVGAHFDRSPREVLTPRDRGSARARYVAGAVLYRVTPMSWPEVAASLHTTHPNLLHGLQVVSEDPDLRVAVTVIAASIEDHAMGARR